MIADQIPAIGGLSIRDKYILANELWEKIETNGSSIPFPSMIHLERRREA